MPADTNPKHAAPPHTARLVIAMVAALVIIAGICYIVFAYPNLGLNRKPAPVVCSYAATKVTVVLVGSPSCKSLYSALAQDTDRDWIAQAPAGEQFAQLAKGPWTIAVYDAGNRQFAGQVADWFQKMQWQPEPVTRQSPTG